jgi:hypothetical protein
MPRKILVAHEDEELRTYIQRELREERYETVEAARFEDAVKILSTALYPRVTLLSFNVLFDFMVADLQRNNLPPHVPLPCGQELYDWLCLESRAIALWRSGHEEVYVRWLEEHQDLIDALTGRHRCIVTTTEDLPTWFEDFRHNLRGNHLLYRLRLDRDSPLTGKNQANIARALDWATTLADCIYPSIALQQHEPAA